MHTTPIKIFTLAANRFHIIVPTALSLTLIIWTVAPNKIPHPKLPALPIVTLAAITLSAVNTMDRQSDFELLPFFVVVMDGIQCL